MCTTCAMCAMCAVQLEASKAVAAAAIAAAKALATADQYGRTIVTETRKFAGQTIQVRCASLHFPNQVLNQSIKLLIKFSTEFAGQNIQVCCAPVHFLIQSISLTRPIVGAQQFSSNTGKFAGQQMKALHCSPSLSYTKCSGCGWCAQVMSIDGHIHTDRRVVEISRGSLWNVSSLSIQFHQVETSHQCPGFSQLAELCLIMVSRQAQYGPPPSPFATAPL